MFTRYINSKGDALFYSFLLVLWVGLAVWQIVNLARIPIIIESGSLGGTLLYGILTLGLLAWSVVNSVGISKDLLSYRDRVKVDG